MPRLVDSHCHVHFPAFADTREAVLERMRDLGVWAITVGTTEATSREAVVFADAHEEIWATVGYHPQHFSSSYTEEGEEDAGQYAIDEIRRVAASSPKVVAIGETGLDFYRIDEGRDAAAAKNVQENALRDHLRLAHELHLPVVIHCRDAFSRLAEVLHDARRTTHDLRGVVHCFTGTWAEAKPLLDLGLHLSFTGIITFPPKKSQDPEMSALRVVERMPLDRLLVETDAPWLAPAPHRGEQNEPAYVEYVAERVAELRGISVEEAAKQTTKNSRALFRI